MKPNFDLSLYLVTDRGMIGERDFCQTILAAVAGGVSLVQFRDKDSPFREQVRLARELGEMLKPLGIPLIINDRLDLALAARAEGLHLGQDDLELKTARELLGPEAIIGVSVGNPAEARKAEAEGADYLGAGVVFETGTKQDYNGTIGVSGLNEILRAVKLPVVAIGGIGRENLAELKKAEGLGGIAVVSAILARPDPSQAARELLSLWQADQ